MAPCCYLEGGTWKYLSPSYVSNRTFAVKLESLNTCCTLFMLSRTTSLVRSDVPVCTNKHRFSDLGEKNDTLSRDLGIQQQVDTSFFYLWHGYRQNSPLGNFHRSNRPPVVRSISLYSVLYPRFRKAVLEALPVEPSSRVSSEQKSSRVAFLVTILCV